MVAVAVSTPVAASGASDEVVVVDVEAAVAEVGVEGVAHAGASRSPARRRCRRVDDAGAVAGAVAGAAAVVGTGPAGRRGDVGRRTRGRRRATIAATAASTAGRLAPIGRRYRRANIERMAAAATRAAVERYLAALNAHDADAIAAAVTGRLRQRAHVGAGRQPRRPGRVPRTPSTAS